MATAQTQQMRFIFVLHTNNSRILKQYQLFDSINGQERLDINYKSLCYETPL